MKKKALSVWHVIVPFAVLIAVWQLGYLASPYPDALFPSPLETANALGGLIASGRLASDIEASLYRYVIGYVLACALGVALGLMLGWFSRAWNYVNPIVQFLRPISPMAWLPFIVLLLGIGDVPAIAIVFIAAFFPVLIGTVSAVRSVDPIYLKVAGNFGLTSAATVFKVVFPAAFPQIMNALRTAIGTAWIFLVAGEMVGAQSGLGYLIIDARNDLSADQLLAAIVVIGIIGFILDTLVRLLDEHVKRSWGGAV
ncbi:MAG: ABC transporter permease [Eggerthellaceae bacterium]|jgi:NitT/TauT family transport system permease protein